MNTDWDAHWDKSGKFCWGVWNWAISRAYKALLKNVDLSDFSMLELGAGSGKNSHLIAEELGSSEVNLVDFNKKAQNISKKTFADFNGSVNYFYNDVLNFDSDEKYDLVHSEGLIEHFYGQSRINLFQKHADLCKKNKYVIIFVPYESFSYSCFEFFCKLLNIWKWDEKIFTKQEVYDSCEESGLEVISEYTSPFVHEMGVLAKKV